MPERRDQPRSEHHTAGELLGDWRAADRDAVAAREAAKVAALALTAAHAAEEAALEADAAARAAVTAVTMAKDAAQRAKKAATAAAEAATLLTVAAEGDSARADQGRTVSEQAETDAADRFHDAERKGFPKESR